MLAAASVVLTATGTEYFHLVLSSTVLHNPHFGPNNTLLVGAGEPSGGNETDYVFETGEKDRNLFFIVQCFVGKEERFLLARFTGDKPLVTFFLVILVDADLDFCFFLWN